MPLGLLIAGPVADRLGVQSWYIIGGSICILTTLVATFIPAIMSIQQNQVSAESPAAAD